MSSKLVLYYFPGSYYSQKAYLTLQEKQLQFTEHLVYISSFGEQNEDWFLKLNPAGTIPVIKDGDDVICESEVIINYLDRKTDAGPRLVPEANTAMGQRVERMRKLLDDIPIEEVSYGVLLNQSLRWKSTDFLKASEMIVRRDKYEKYLKEEIANFERRLKADSSLQEVMTKKIARYLWKLENVFNKEHCRVLLDDLQQTFDTVEQELEQSQKESSLEDVYLCGTTFTAADITMVAFLNRLTSIGIEERYYSASKRPKVFAYCQRVFNRPGAKALLSNVSTENMRRLLMAKLFKHAAKKVAKVVVVVGAVAVVAYGVKKYLDKTR